ncbi:MAG: putative esterase [Verrucomicrobiales bacterium]|nr:putative esterase [Verrucomicrobiales bacterium]
MYRCTGRYFSWVSAMVALCLFASAGRAEPRLDVVEFESQTLQNNPLHDPTLRKLAVFLPSQMTNNTALPVVYYLPGWGGSSEKVIQSKEKWLTLVQSVADQVTPMILVVVDGRTHWGGSQYVNSTAQGNYADYIGKEIVTKVEAEYPKLASHEHRVIAGHSSGGYGALCLGMQFQNQFESVIALSPDSDFDVTHLPFVKMPDVANVSLAEINKLMKAGRGLPAPKEGDLAYALGLCAAYAPSLDATHPEDFEWLYDDKGNFRQTTWQRWLDHDPYTQVRKNKNAFLPTQSIYVEGAAQDEYQANIGARKIYEVLRNRPARSTFYEPPGKHSDHTPQRLQRGLAWVFHRPMQDVK